MRRLLALGVLGLGLMAARPGNEFNLVTQLNGQPSRWVLQDGGRSGVFTVFDAGANSYGCMDLTGATNSVGAAVSPNVIVVVPLMPVNVCVRPSVFSPAWDGGCNTIPTDENYGVPMQAGVPQYMTPDLAARALCVVSDAGFIVVPVWTVQ